MRTCINPRKRRSKPKGAQVKHVTKMKDQTITLKQSLHSKMSFSFWLAVLSTGFHSIC